VALYIAVALGAFLLFLVQPMAARFILPWFGGGPAVWSSCLLFFQVALLAGYAYAHVTRRLSLVRQTRLHLTLLGLAILTLPIAPSASWAAQETGAPAARILLLLTVTVGAPYVVLAATAPLLQDWFARSGMGAAPYRLYALSNLGSLLALLAYPALAEPFLPLRAQSLGWSALFVLFAVACGVATLRFVRHAAHAGTRAVEAPAGELEAGTPADAAAPPSRGDQVMWLLWSACGSGLLLAATNQLCLDIAVVPLLWIAPLTLYLLTFIVCFAGWYRRWMWSPLLLAGIGGTAWLLRHTETKFLWEAAGLAGALVAGCMVCHGELVRSRPPASRLTSFYLAIAAGGSLGGLSVALLAPAVLERLWEYPFFVVLPLALLLVALFRDPASPVRRRAHPIVWAVPCVIILGAAVFGVAKSPIPKYEGEVARARNFYGIITVSDDGTGEMVRLRRPSTAASCTARSSSIRCAARWRRPTTARRAASTWRSASTPIARPAVRCASASSASAPARWPRGARTAIACASSRSTARGAVRAEVLSSFADSRAAVDVVIGDARLSIQRGLRDGTGVRLTFAIDAFSGDAIPVRTCSRARRSRYREALAPDGVLAVHVSNQYSICGRWFAGSRRSWVNGPWRSRARTTRSWASTAPRGCWSAPIPPSWTRPRRSRSPSRQARDPSCGPTRSAVCSR
jgi:hypothetical protein